tara:strand:+ start:2246 stop:2797 length:552 start_codon:yes stop_codon:yes gene_type:complete
MLLNPTKIQNAQEAPAGSVQAQDPFDSPIPGQSLTDEPGKWPWDKPPEMTDVDDAVAFIVGKVLDNPEAREQVEKLMMAGMPIESITNTLAFAGFAEGKWTPDVAELTKPPVSAFLVALAFESNIPAIMFNNRETEQPISDDQVMYSMRESNPEAFAHIQRQAVEDDLPPSNFLEMEGNVDNG